MRNIGVDALAALNATLGEEVFLVSIEYSGGTLYMNTGSRPLLHDGETWDAVGGGLSLGSIEESGDMRGEGLDIMLSGVDQSIAAILLAQEFRGRSVFVGQAILNQTTGVLTDVITWFDGLQLDNYEISENVVRGKPLTSTVKTRVRHRLAQDEFAGIRSNVHAHQRYFPDDTFWQHAASIVGQKFFWGTSAPTSVGGGGGDSGTNPWDYGVNDQGDE